MPYWADILPTHMYESLCFFGVYVFIHVDVACLGFLLARVFGIRKLRVVACYHLISVGYLGSSNSSSHTFLLIFLYINLFLELYFLSSFFLGFGVY